MILLWDNCVNVEQPWTSSKISRQLEKLFYQNSISLTYILIRWGRTWTFNGRTSGLAQRNRKHQSQHRPIFNSLNFDNLLLNPFNVCDSIVCWSNLFHHVLSYCLWESFLYNCVPVPLDFLTNPKKWLYGTVDKPLINLKVLMRSARFLLPTNGHSPSIQSLIVIVLLSFKPGIILVNLSWIFSNCFFLSYPSCSTETKPTSSIPHAV